jgi:hypothetical protein
MFFMLVGFWRRQLYHSRFPPSFTSLLSFVEGNGVVLQLQAS